MCQCRTPDVAGKAAMQNSSEHPTSLYEPRGFEPQNPERIPCSYRMGTVIENITQDFLLKRLLVRRTDGRLEAGTEAVGRNAGQNPVKRPELQFIDITIEFAPVDPHAVRMYEQHPVANVPQPDAPLQMAGRVSQQKQSVGRGRQHPKTHAVQRLLLRKHLLRKKILLQHTIDPVKARIEKRAMILHHHRTVNEHRMFFVSRCVHRNSLPPHEFVEHRRPLPQINVDIATGPVFGNRIQTAQCNTFEQNGMQIPLFAPSEKSPRRLRLTIVTSFDLLDVDRPSEQHVPRRTKFRRQSVQTVVRKSQHSLTRSQFINRQPLLRRQRRECAPVGRLLPKRAAQQDEQSVVNPLHRNKRSYFSQIVVQR